MAFEAIPTDEPTGVDETLRTLYRRLEARPVPHRFNELVELLEEAPWSARKLAAA